MKRILFYLMVGLVSVIMASCDAIVKPLTNNLAIYHELSTDHKQVLSGIKDVVTGKIILKADHFTEINTDDNLIFCTKENPTSILVLTLDGTPLGTFEKVNHWQHNGDYYLCVKNRWRCYYFPKLKENIWTDKVYCTSEYMVLENQDFLEIRTYTGEIVWKVPKNCIILKNVASEEKEELFFAITEDEATNVYNIHGQKLKTFSIHEWRKAKGKLKRASDEQNTALELYEGIALK